MDDAASLGKLCDELFAGSRQAHAGYAAPHTREFIVARLREAADRQRLWPGGTRKILETI